MREVCQCVRNFIHLIPRIWRTSGSPRATPSISRLIRRHLPIPIRPNPGPTHRPTLSCRRLIRRPVPTHRPREREAACWCLQVPGGFLCVDKKPTEEGKRLWPPDGYLRLNPEVDARGRVACACTEECCNCKGECGCEACALAWMIYQDDQALWDEKGELVNGVDLGTAWRGVADPRQLRLRFHAEEK